MPLSKEAMRELSTGELSAIFKLGEFESQKELLIGELESRSDLGPGVFLKVHHSSDCRIGLIEYPKPEKVQSWYFNEPYVANVYRYRLWCQRHEVKS